MKSPVWSGHDPPKTFQRAENFGNSYVLWASAPFRVQVAARRLENWRSENHCAAWPPPAEISASLETINLVPYDTTRLRTNGAAKATATGSFGGVGLLLSTEKERSALPMRLLDGISDELEAHDLHLSISRLSDEKLTGRGAPKMLREMMCDGLLIDYTHAIPEALLKTVADSSLKAIWLNSQQRADCVWPDDLNAARDATRRLLEAGHKNLVYVDWNHDADDANAHYSARDRRAGFEQIVAKAGLNARVEEQLLGFDARLEPARAMLSAPDAPTAVLTYGSCDAEAFAVAALMLGLRLGRDLSLVTLGPQGLRIAGQKVAAQIVPEYGIGRRAVELLRSKIAAPNQEFAPIQLPFIWDAARTFGPAPV